jgi:hypothetical protein
VSKYFLIFLLFLSSHGIYAMTAPSNSLSRDISYMSGQSDSEPPCHNQIISSQSGLRNFDMNGFCKDQPGMPISNKYRSDKREYRYVMNDRLHHRVGAPNPMVERFLDAGCILIVDIAASVRIGETMLTVEKRE